MTYKLKFLERHIRYKVRVYSVKKVITMKNGYEPY